MDDLESSIRVDIEFHVSKPSLMNFIEQQRLEITHRTKIPSDAAMRRSGYLPALSLHSMFIETRNLAMQYWPQLNYTIHNTGFISSAVGSIHM